MRTAVSKIVATTAILAALITGVFGQGLVVFQNTSTTLISVNAGVTSGTFYYALLCAPPGTTDRTQFVFTGLYATNTASPGRFLGGTQCNSNWPAATTKAFFVA